MRRLGVITIDDFARKFDEFFDELLIAPWRERRAVEEFARSHVIDRGDRYEVKIVFSGADPASIEVEMKGQQLCVRAPAGGEGKIESAFSFAAPIDAGAVRAKWAADTLTISLPKSKPSRIKINEP